MSWRPRARYVLGVSVELLIRPGREADVPGVLELWDIAIAWMVERGQPEQWGTEPASANERARRAVREWQHDGGLRIAELDGVAVGASAISAAPPPHVAPLTRPETYLQFLISDRRHAGRGIGAALVHHALAEARAARSQLLRVDCWAGAPRLVSWYEQQGFIRSGTFTVGQWHGQVFELEL